MRRDAKNALEQRAVPLACGDVPMVTVELLGRAVRLWGTWWALCSFCGALTAARPHNRFGGEICCLRCDTALLKVDPPKPAERPRPVCRFCGKVELERTAGARFRSMKTPLDTFGHNANLPPPLRHVYYCTAHWRAWAANAHRTLATRFVLAHIASGAKPVFPSEPATEADLGFAAAPAKRVTGKRKKLLR